MHYYILVYLIQHVGIVMNFIRYFALKNHRFAVKNADLGVIVYVQAYIEEKSYMCLYV